MSEKRFLLVTRVGWKSLHRNWIASAVERDFDVVLSAYNEAVHETVEGCVIFERRPGRKLAGYSGFLKERCDLWSRYDHICLMDEDIDVSTEALNRLFALCAAHDLKIAQPALSHDSHFTYAALLAQPVWELRWVNFIEMMCPVFRRDVLEQVAPLFEAGMESGIDLIWCNAVSENPRDFAVLDPVQIRHTQPVGSNKRANGFEGHARYEDDIFALLDHYGLPWLSCVPYAGRTRHGRLVEWRLWFLMAALTLLPAIPRQSPVRARLRSVAVHLRHLAIRRPRNIPVHIRRALRRT